MAEGTARTDGFFARGIEGISHHARPALQDLPELPDLQRLAPPELQRQLALERLLSGHALDLLLQEAIRPAIVDPEILLPRPFARALEDMQEAIQRSSERHGAPAVLERAAKILAQERDWRELARTCREALHQV